RLTNSSFNSDNGGFNAVLAGGDLRMADSTINVKGGDVRFTTGGNGGALTMSQSQVWSDGNILFLDEGKVGVLNLDSSKIFSASANVRINTNEGGTVFMPGTSGNTKLTSDMYPGEEADPNDPDSVAIPPDRTNKGLIVVEEGYAGSFDDGGLGNVFSPDEATEHVDNEHPSNNVILDWNSQMI